MQLFKLTDDNHETRNHTKWGPNVTHTADLSHPPKLCTLGLIHAYTDPLLAVFFNPIHSCFYTPILWEATTTDPNPVSDNTKIGVRSLTTIRIIPLPVITHSQRVRVAIQAAKMVTPLTYTAWHLWADRWLDGTDRSRESARAAYAAADAAYAAYVAAYAAAATAAATAADAAYVAAYVAAYAAAAYVAAYAADAAKVPNTLDIIKKAIIDEPHPVQAD